MMTRRPTSKPRSVRLPPTRATANDKFEFAIKIRSGETINTVGEAVAYIEGLSQAIRRRSEWQRVIGYLHRAVTEDRAWMFFARMSLQRAIGGNAAATPPKPRISKAEAWREKRAAVRARPKR